MQLVDTHLHLYSSQFAEDLDELVKKAKEAQVSHFFLPAIDRSYFEKMHKVNDRFPQESSMMMGLHPCYVKPESYKEELAFVYQLLQSKKYVAVGEIGIDLYWDKTTLAIQQEAFAQQIRWAEEFQLPINIHCRDAFNEVFEVLESFNRPISGIFHCFTGTKENAQRAIDLGLKLGIGGVATFKNGKIDQFLKDIPLEHIVLETDGPYLAPAPHRGKRNEPAFLRLVAEKLSEIYGISLEAIALQTTKNAVEVYQLPEICEK